MELRHLRYFVAVAEALHFSRAAVRLHITQPALSRQIRDLEDELGAQLFRRHGTETTLTTVGVQFLVHAKEILDLAERSVQEIKEVPRSIRLGHYGTLWVDYYGSALRTFSKRHPKITLHAIEQTSPELVASLRRGDVDVALLGPTDRALAKEFAVRRLGVLPAMIAMSAAHPLAKRRKLALSDLRDVSWTVWDEKFFPGREAPLREAAAAAGFKPRIGGAVDSVASLFLQLATSENVGYVLPMSKKLPHAGIVFVELKPPGIGLVMDVAWRRDVNSSSEVMSLVELLASVPPTK